MALRTVWRIAVCLTIFSGCLGLCPSSVVLSSNAISGDSSTSASGKPPLSAKFTWIDRVHQLIEYKDQHGDTLVPKRYGQNPALGNWVNKQRQKFRNCCENGNPCSLTEERIRVLNEVGFCWDGNTRTTNRKGGTWWKRLEELKGHSSLAEGLPTSLNNWLRQQRQEYQSYQSGEASKLDEKKIQALNLIHPDWWKTLPQRRWDARCLELVAYQEQHGDCCVPIGYENPKLANWVSNVRKSYKLKMSGKVSNLKDEQIGQLNSMSFVWNRWDYEYQKKLQKTLSLL
jgi:hypothetical protein